ncbi:hypothetical protein J1N35_021735 [Gossypium stocksii]|uniref:SWIM-type domain-containing protein n=1 Tax=Gossypium stocksii TaxID=47602 RepID=A0A9D3VGE0_9ROSI|nr:hypothetical protein J1N35_021735 [Gossypium stocksii]
MLNINLDAAHASEFPEYVDIVPVHRLTSNSQFEELFVGQQFENKANCVFAIKQYNMKLSINYKILLIAIAQGDNRNVLPIAFAIIESENFESWVYFIQNLRRHVVRQDNICIIFDRLKSLVAAIRQSEVPWRFVYCIRHIAVNFHNKYKNKDWRKQIVNMDKNIVFKFVFVNISSPFPNWDGNIFYPNTYVGYELKAHRFRHKLASNLNAKNGVETNKTVREYIDCRSGIPPQSYGVDLRNRQCECGMFQTLQYLCTHVVAACATYSLNVEQYIDDVYTLEHTLHIWGNKFPVLRDVLTWEVQLSAFKILPDRSLRRRVKGRSITMNIQNDMDIRDQVDLKHCTICKTVGRNRSKCPYENVYTGQSSWSEKNLMLYLVFAFYDLLEIKFVLFSVELLFKINSCYF